ncbi:hypothetical protein NDU88_006096 [Pleurodeles waltl]|uniref:Uncharacterized protein n=1 Tax=Pleurodeles waltl TaxID=8319 RepID=A0AAV7WCF1_PLEWA|nr:hypothetical protein NDU88_006096 [Pleurodeles waltl]
MVPRLGPSCGGNHRLAPPAREPGVCRFGLLSPRRGPRRSHSDDRSSLGRPLGGPRAFSAWLVSRGLTARVEAPGPSGRRCARFACPPRRASQSKESSPYRGLPLSLGSASTALHIRSRRAGARRWPGPPGSLLTGRRSAASPVHGVSAPERSAGSSRAAHITPAQRWLHQRPAAQLQPRRGTSTSAAILDFGRSGRDERSRLNPRRHSYQKDPQ